MSRMMIVLALISVSVGCSHCKKWTHCGSACAPAQGCEAPPACTAAAPAAAPQAAPVAQAPMLAPQYMAPQPQYMAAAPMMAPQPQGVTGAVGLSVVRIPLPVPKLYAVPKPAPPQMIAIHQAPMMAPPMMMAPPAAPSCPSTDAANNALLMALLQAQQQQNTAPPQTADEADLEARAQKLEQRIDALTNALEKNN